MIRTSLLKCSVFGNFGDALRGWMRVQSGALGAAVHGLVGQAVGVLIFVAEGVDDLEGVELGDFLPGLLEEGPQAWAFDLVLALDLLDHQLGVGDDAEALRTVLDGPLQHRQKAGVFGVIIGLDAKELAEAGYDATLGVFNDGAIAGGAGIAAGAAVAMGGEPAFGGGGSGSCKEISSHWLPVYRAMANRRDGPAHQTHFIASLECGQFSIPGERVRWRRMR